MRVQECLLVFALVGQASGFSISGASPSPSRLSRLSSLEAIPQDPKNPPPEINRRKLYAQAVGLGALTAGKIILDGPKYKETPDLSGKNIVITGGNTGLGLASAKQLAGYGANILIASRSPEKGQAAVEEVKESLKDKEEGKKGNIDTLQLDLADLKSIKEFASALRQKFGKDFPLDVLMNNAGVMAIPQREETADGFEKQLGINHLGHFLLTSLLLENVAKASKGRVVNVSSRAHELASPDWLEDLQLTKEGAYDPWKAYGRSKLANILFTRELDRRLRAANSDIVTLACHPGLVRTELGRYFFNGDNLGPLAIGLVPFLPIGIYASRSPERGAQTQIFCSADDRVLSESGDYFANCKVNPGSDASRDFESAAKLWKESVRLTGASFAV
uniref:Uncharacterized protein n=1 Tax=Chromera velia CCMP2878 TaxID=1169474 RepID=A0A0G4H233_9ALVE|mmetsp:Transcript_24165/g.47507  ORF Transcript_24165/g.47507 Transcript_24165/m.47507 type:complete len:390 (+) Transcript_24165:27-1196(+)|eukprot:Cvel_5580.t1-p1 / transcript=Cvel_5580.t1 / gene=Cvel_5580 / organism=Chromera_velia_CCMP2878 / gene_product=Retinol dehydrogenase 13, putative / transcript_product=Retinol dehydrogenase 13, putative / location=Cvel_scaffold262:55226-61205(-) / protein_length=389 / sequence_SO=supercontig / SO=protein_coding / is_pseudo=false